MASVGRIVPSLGAGEESGGLRRHCTDHDDGRGDDDGEVGEGDDGGGEEEEDWHFGYGCVEGWDCVNGDHGLDLDRQDHDDRHGHGQDGGAGGEEEACYFVLFSW